MLRPWLREQVVIYLTVSMTLAVRALAVFLTVWLTAAASIPPCCWSMASAHGHQAPQHASATTVQPHAEHHHDHESGDSAAPQQSTPAMSAVPTSDCGTASVEAVTTPRAPLSSAEVRARGTARAEVLVPRVSVTWSERPDSAPPGGSFGSSFLNPLRI